MRILVVGAGDRGSTYARLAARDGRADIVAVADPSADRRLAFAAEHGLPPAAQFTDWREVTRTSPIADAVVIATPDRQHAEPAIAFAGQGYHVLLEKPMAPTADEAAAIVTASAAGGVTLAICHVLRYTPYTRRLKLMLDSGLIGEVVSVEHLEPVGWWHQAHSYVRGNWRREDTSTFMLMSKSVHDLDWLTHVIGRTPRRVSSFGGLYHFRPEQAPVGAGDRCLDCPAEPTCPYSAPRFYLSCLGDPALEQWPLSAVTEDRTPSGVLAALRTGPYGRCVYKCDNDVVDHQVVNIEYDAGVTASFTMTAFTPLDFRKTRIFGTHGSIDGNGRQLEVTDFRNGNRHTVDIVMDEGTSVISGHGGGDAGLVRAFITEIAAGGKGTGGLASPTESFQSHRLAWAAESARRTGQVVALT